MGLAGCSVEMLGICGSGCDVKMLVDHGSNFCVQILESGRDCSIICFLTLECQTGAWYNRVRPTRKPFFYGGVERELLAMVTVVKLYLTDL